MNADLIGTQILHFRILEGIGLGGMGAVFKAEDALLGRVVALKFLPFFLTPGPEEVARFEREAKAAASANHPNLCTVYGFYTTPEFRFIAMEYVPGDTLKRALESEGAMSCGRALDILGSVAEALAAAHRQGVIHRDVKSDNIMLTPDGGVKVMDFGLATFRDAPGITKTGEILGTVAYMSPEQAEGKPVDCRTDLWSLGVVLYEMLTGDLPFHGDSDVAILQNILHARPLPLARDRIRAKKPVRYILSTLLEKDVRFRYPSADRLVGDIHRNVKNPGFRLAWRAARKNALKCAVAFGLTFTLGFAVYIPLRDEARKPAWLRPEAELVRLTTESGVEEGSVSPSGRYLAYMHDQESLHIKDLLTGDNVIGEKSLLRNFKTPIWSGDESGVFFPFQSLSIHRWGVDWSRHIWNKKEVLFPQDSTAVYHISLSPDNRWMTACRVTMTTSTLWLYGISDSSRRCLERSTGQFIFFSAWHPDSRHVSFFNPGSQDMTAVIRTRDIQSGETSNDLAEVRHYTMKWYSSGLAFSPDGRYIVFPDSMGASVQLVALHVSANGMQADGKPKSFTRFPEYQRPYRPMFDRKGDILSFMVDESVYEINIARVDPKLRRIGNEMVPILTDKVLSSECEWSKDGKHIVYVSKMGNQFDVHLLNRETRLVSRLTYSSGDEEFPSFVPGDESISFLMNGTVLRMPLAGGSPYRVYPPESDSFQRTVYRYAWGLDVNTLYAVVSPGSGEKQNLYSLIRTDLREGISEVLCRIPAAIPPGIEIRPSPDGKWIAYRVRNVDKPLFQSIVVLDLRSGRSRRLAEESAIVPNGDLAWTSDGKSLFFRSNEMDASPYGMFYRMDLSADAPERITIPERFEDCMPGQISPAGDEIIIYRSRYERDVWALKTRSSAEENKSSVKNKKQKP